MTRVSEEAKKSVRDLQEAVEDLFDTWEPTMAVALAVLGTMTVSTAVSAGIDEDRFVGELRDGFKRMKADLKKKMQEAELLSDQPAATTH